MNQKIEHPGLALECLLKYKNIKNSAFAFDAKIYPSHLTDIIKGRRSITPKVALKIERVLEENAESWLLLQAYYDLEQLRVKEKSNE